MRILIADDDRLSREILERALRGLGYDHRSTEDGAEAWALHEQEPFDVIISDWKMPGLDGLELCRRVRAKPSTTYTYFILLTVAGGRENLERGFEAGVDDFLTKPLDPDMLRVRLTVAARVSRLHQRHQEDQERIALLEEQAGARGAFEGLVGKSESMQEVFRHLRLAAQTDVIVLLTGESGTGKELAARAIHSRSARREKPFLAVNCSALPETLLESHLFGHVKGSFTGADRDKVGLFEAADGGTLFLDEIGDVSPVLQLKLLRVLQEREIQRVGENRTRRVDVRIVTATNQDLARRVGEGTLREDFYYRIKVFEITLPPLRRRRADVLLLLDHLLERLGGERGKKIASVAEDARKQLLDYPWPGNVRELANAVEYALIIMDGDRLELAHLPPEIRDPSLRRPELMPEPMLTPDETEERRSIEEALEEANGSRTEAARALGISRVTLWKKIRRYAIEVD